MPETFIADRLDRLRGPVPPRNYDARTIAALTSNPGCARRAVLDAAGVDKRRLAEQVGFEARYGQSAFAIARGNSFERLVKADSGAALCDLLRDTLGLPVGEHEWVDLGEGGRAERHHRTRELFARAIAAPDEPAALADHPMLALEVGGRTAYVEPDVVAFRVGGPQDPDRRWYLAEIKAFAVIDGQADPVKVAEAATQAAVYVLALQRLLTELGLSEEAVATEVVLVCPRDFTNAPTAVLVDVRRQVAAVRRQLARLARVAALVGELDPALTFDPALDRAGVPTRDAAELDKAVAVIEARYTPECVSRCEMAFYCRSEARAAGSTAVFGRAVRDALGGVSEVGEALALADGTVQPDGDAENGESARLLRMARRARLDALRDAG
jgi:hypothetical protein